MALISPGVQVTVSDESQYTPTAAGSIAYVLLATAQDKRNPAGGIAAYTTKATAESLYTITSQRDLVSKYGNIEFKTDTAGNPINGDEQNEYGLLAAYSALGVSNQVYVQRADVDLDQLTGTTIRPTGSPANNTYWLDVSATGTDWGIWEWGTDGNVFIKQTPTVITNTADVSGTVPLTSVGAIGDYAVVTTSTANPIYKKRYDNTWNLVGSEDWQDGVPTITGLIANPANLAVGQKMRINGTNVTMSGTTVTTAAADIVSASIQGISARANSSGQLELFGDDSSASSGNVVLKNGNVKIEIGGTNGIGGVDCSLKLGLWDSYDTGNTKIVATPTVQFDSYRSVPAWKKEDAYPRPAGSVWLKTSATGDGADYGTKIYSTITSAWIDIASPLYSSDNAAIYALSPVAGGSDLAIGSLYTRYDTTSANDLTAQVYRKAVEGTLKITGTAAGGTAVYTVNDSFTLEVSVPATTTTQSATVTLTGTTATTLVTDVLAKGLPNVVAAIESDGAISFSHLAGGTIRMTYGTGTPLTLAGLSVATNVQIVSAGSVFLASPFKSTSLYIFRECTIY